MERKTLRRFIGSGLPDNWVISDCKAGVTRILDNYVDNRLLEESLEEIRRDISVLFLQEDLTACQKFVLTMLNCV